MYVVMGISKNSWMNGPGTRKTDADLLKQEKDFTVVNQHGLVGTQKWTNKLKVGETGWNDQAVLAASKSKQSAPLYSWSNLPPETLTPPAYTHTGNKAIKEMKPRYGLIDNNCQIFASHLLLQLGIKMGTDINTAQDMRDKLLAEFSKTSTSWRKKLTNKDWQAPTFLKVQEIRRSISPAFGGSVEPQPEPHEEVVMQERQAKIRPFSWGRKKEVVAQLPTPP